MGGTTEHYSDLIPQYGVELPAHNIVALSTVVKHVCKEKYGVTYVMVELWK